MSVSVVVKNGAKTTGEGPHWDQENNCLLYVDIICGDVHKWDAATNTDTKVHLGKSYVIRWPYNYMVGSW